MTAEERKDAYARLLRECPEVLTPRMVAKWTRQSKNTVYAEIRSGDLPAVPYRRGYLIAKADLIDYMVTHAEDTQKACFTIGNRYE
ncbi:MAG: helix-turn-helix domain-containing protein [Clostridia bacterium]|nr:helix-turn-helix domain-containing protein [Clostridia bacterium]